MLNQPLYTTSDHTRERVTSNSTSDYIVVIIIKAKRIHFEHEYRNFRTSDPDRKLKVCDEDYEFLA